MDVSENWLTQRVEEPPTFYAATPPEGVGLRTRMAWQRLKAHAVEGDELWAFSNPPSTWRKLGKLSGYAIVRGGSIIESVQTSR